MLKTVITTLFRATLSILSRKTEKKVKIVGGFRATIFIGVLGDFFWIGKKCPKLIKFMWKYRRTMLIFLKLKLNILSLKLRSFTIESRSKNTILLCIYMIARCWTIFSWKQYLPHYLEHFEYTKSENWGKKFK